MGPKITDIVLISLQKLNLIEAPCQGEINLFLTPPLISSYDIFVQLAVHLTADPGVISSNPSSASIITKTHLFKYIENFNSKN